MGIYKLFIPGWMLTCNIVVVVIKGKTMKICLAQIEIIPCRPDKNYETMTNAIVQGKSQKADMIIFPELCIPGYLIGDTWKKKPF